MVCPIPHISECNCLKFLLTIRYNLLKIDPPPVPRNSFYGNCLVVDSATKQWNYYNGTVGEILILVLSETESRLET